MSSGERWPHETHAGEFGLQRRVGWFLLMIVISWVVMTLTHETGHLIGGALSGATLTDCDLAPWRLPYCLHSPDPHPLVTLWAGPVLGVIVPFLAAMMLRVWWAWFIADFCLIANGIYLALAWVSGDRYLDTPRLLAAGTHPVFVFIFCALTIGFGYPRFRDRCMRVLANPSDENEPT
ncbi:putative membrane protein [Rhodopirellula sp. SWK7]|nr:putative membrane protein [Rhodopirellula sp. SWK7]